MSCILQTCKTARLSRASENEAEHNEGTDSFSIASVLRYVRLIPGQTARALTALVARLAFVTEQSRRLAVISIMTALVAWVAFITEQPWGLRRSDSLLQLIDFQTDF